MEDISVVDLKFPDGSTVASLLGSSPTPKSLEHFDSEYHKNYGLLTIDTHFTLMAMKYGRPYAFQYEQNGRVVQNLFPIQKNELEQISSSSKSTLEMHTETAFHTLRPHLVFLLCAREDPQAHTNYALLSSIIPLLSTETIRILHQQLFVTEVDQSFLSDSDTSPRVMTPVLFDSGSRMTYDRALMRGATVRAQKALDELSAVIDCVTRKVTLRQGQVLILRNDTVVHGRSPFTPRYDGTDRWLKRIMVRTGFFDPDVITIGKGGLPIVQSRV